MANNLSESEERVYQAMLRGDYDEVKKEILKRGQPKRIRDFMASLPQNEAVREWIKKLDDIKEEEENIWLECQHEMMENQV